MKEEKMFSEKENRLIQLITELNMETDEFFSYVKRPKTAGKTISVERENKYSEELAIIMQGPLVLEDEFTEETVRIYDKLFPGVRVIVSTWMDEDANTIDKLNKLDNCSVVLNEYPKCSGVRNTNYQIVSTMSGLEEAKRRGAKYVFKTRCDFRFYKIGILDFMVNLLYQFPVDKNIAYQKYRIICGNVLGGGIYRAWWLADQYVFGHIDDMLNYWNYTLDEVDMTVKYTDELLKTKHYTYKKRIEEWLAGEPNIVRNYIYRNEGFLPEVNIKLYFERVRKQFITVSGQELGAYWQKYDMKIVESVRNGTYCSVDDETKLLTYDWNFVRWMNLYSGTFVYEEDYEKYMELNKH